MVRALFMGQTGLAKKSELDSLAHLCASMGHPIDRVFNVGDIMYAESQTAGKALQEGKILDLPLAELGILRRLAFTRIRLESSSSDQVLVASHSVFRWNNQLFRAFELQELQELKPDLVVTLIDDVEAVKLRLDDLRDEGQLPITTSYSLKDLLVWREEEVLASEIISSVLGIPHYVLGTWLEPEVSETPLEVAYNLMFHPERRLAYISYPISDAQPKAEIWQKVINYRRLVRPYVTAFDPLMISEKRLQALMAEEMASNPGARDLVCDVRGRELVLNIGEIGAVMPDIDGQTVSRDYKLLDQSDMIIAYFPLDADGGPLIAGGVQSEIEHASASTKEIVIVWESPREPTPFIKQKADVLLRSLDQLDEHLQALGPAR